MAVLIVSSTNGNGCLGLAHAIGPPDVQPALCNISNGAGRRLSRSPLGTESRASWQARIDWIDYIVHRAFHPACNWPQMLAH
jgi:hypothetical protein